MQINRPMLLFTLIAVTAGVPTALFGQSSGPEITIRISSPRKTVTAGKPVRIEVKVSNNGDEPTLVANSISLISGGAATLTFKLTDARGHDLQGMHAVVDNFVSPPLSDENAPAKLLGNWTLLRTGTSLLFTVRLDETWFRSLGKPGKYKLSAIYSASCKSFAHDRLCLNENAFDSLPFPCWSGKLPTNEISLAVEPPNTAKE